ncbi:glycosyltransferase [Ornithinibacillus sp. 4-3]|uniref:Glycosyltransferase n=1 Tax=Ornithinibacillus sp. 4-3 TaxID=3231488 RepID=A0AB39HTC1_9BACI
MNTLLSVCMIVKNEERVIERCLQSIQGIADEIIIVDTGSEDDTKEIASKYTEQVYDFIWVNDFAKARNYAASKATGDWILALDADEYVDRESFEKFKEKLAIKPPQHEINGIEIVSFIGNNASQTALNRHIRFYKNNGLIEYYRSIHEELRHQDETKSEIGLINLTLYHTGYMKDTVKEKQKSDRNLSILLKQKDKKAIDYFYIGNEYNSLGDTEKAIINYQKAFIKRNNVLVDWLKKLFIYLIDALYREKRYKEALEVISDCEEMYPNYADYKYYKGLIYYTQKERKRAKAVFEYILKNKSHLVADHSNEFLELLPLTHLGFIYEKENQLHKAVESYSQAISLNESNNELWSRLLYLLGKHSTLEELATFINNRVVPSHGMNELRMLKILLSVPLLAVQKLTRSLLEEEVLTTFEKEALLIKNYFLDGNLDEVIYLIEQKKDEEIISILLTDIFSISDFIIFSLAADYIRGQNLLLEIGLDDSIDDLLMNIFHNKSTKGIWNKTEEQFFLKTYKQAQVLKLLAVIELLDKKKYKLSKPIKEEIKAIKETL